MSPISQLEVKNPDLLDSSNPCSPKVRWKTGGGPYSRSTQPPWLRWNAMYSGTCKEGSLWLHPHVSVVGAGQCAGSMLAVGGVMNYVFFDLLVLLMFYYDYYFTIMYWFVCIFRSLYPHCLFMSSFVLVHFYFDEVWSLPSFTMCLSLVQFFSMSTFGSCCLIRITQDLNSHAYSFNILMWLCLL